MGISCDLPLRCAIPAAEQFRKRHPVDALSRAAQLVTSMLFISQIPSSPGCLFCQRTSPSPSRLKSLISNRAISGETLLVALPALLVANHRGGCTGVKCNYAG
jgi:hypothetical protein